MTHEDLTAGEGGLAGVTLLPGVRLAEVDACGLEALLAEPAGALVAVCCVRGQLELTLPAAASLSCGEVLSLVVPGAGEKCRVRPLEGPFRGVALVASTDAVAPGAAATLARWQAAYARRGPVTRTEIARCARTLMRQNVESPLTIGELARRCQTSPTVLKESFRAEYGMPVHEWYRRFRMLRAADLLRVGSGSISDVARAVGYSNASKFAQAFSACMGATPSAWRRAALTSASAPPQELAEVG